MIKHNSSEFERKLLMQEEDERKIAEACRRESQDNMKSAEISLRLISEVLAETED